MPGSAELMAALAAPNLPAIAEPTASAGTFGRLARAYLAGLEFAVLAPRTRKDYRQVLDFLIERVDLVPLAKIDGPAVFAIRDETLKSRKRRFTSYVIQVLRIVFALGRPRGMAPELQGNPAADVSQIGRPKNAPTANRAWSDAEIATVLEAASPALRLPIALGAYLGARQGDVLRLTGTAYDGRGGFTFTQEKTDIGCLLTLSCACCSTPRRGRALSSSSGCAASLSRQRAPARALQAHPAAQGCGQGRAGAHLPRPPTHRGKAPRRQRRCRALRQGSGSKAPCEGRGDQARAGPAP